MASRKKNGIAHRDRDFVSEVSRASYEASPLLGHLVLWIALLFVVAALAWASFAERSPQAFRQNSRYSSLLHWLITRVRVSLISISEAPISR